MSKKVLSLGKLPANFLASLLSTLPMSNNSVLLGPGPGLDCAVLDTGDRLLVLTSDPITFTAGELGWYLVQINVNDIATTGARPRWLLATLLFPESKSTEALVRETFDQLARACLQHEITLVGGHTEITQGIDRPIAVGTLVGEVAREDLVTPKGARPGDGLLLTKFVPIEAVAILCQEFPEQLSAYLSPSEIERGAHVVEQVPSGQRFHGVHGLARSLQPPEERDKLIERAIVHAQSLPIDARENNLHLLMVERWFEAFQQMSRETDCSDEPLLLVLHQASQSLLAFEEIVLRAKRMKQNRSRSRRRSRRRG